LQRPSGLFRSFIVESDADPDPETTDNLLAAFRKRWKVSV
jgi:hypothetical protein